MRQQELERERRGGECHGRERGKRWGEIGGSISRKQRRDTLSEEFPPLGYTPIPILKITVWNRQYILHFVDRETGAQGT